MTTIGGTGELRLLELIKDYLGAQAGGDDAAVLEETGPFTIVSTDMAVEGVHFDLAWMTSEDAGWRALALALGDLAAKGAPLTRSAAKPGWSVAVTGPLGGAVLALRRRQALRLEPLLEEGKRLNELGLCCGDISDGLVREMQKFAEMSGCGCDLRAHDVPVADGASLEDALTSGEEVELVCVGPEDLIRKAGLTTVGVLTREREVNLEGAEIATRGYDHFA